MTAESDDPRPLLQRTVVHCALIYVVCAVVYVALLGDRVLETSPNDHFSHLAESWLEGRLDLGGPPPGRNDWACFDTETGEACPPGFGHEGERYRWYVSFPPFPAAVVLPVVAAAGGADAVPDRLFWALIAALGPALLYRMLARLREESGRSLRDDLALTALFAFGTVFFFVAVQGSVWFAAQVVATSLLVLYLDFAQGARRPWAAGAMLGLLLLTRPTTALLAALFGYELMRVHRREDAPALPDEGLVPRLAAWLRGVGWRDAAPRGLRFSAPILAAGALAMAHNAARFGDPFEFGHTYLQIGWRDRIETWGLFNYHYLAKNLAIFTSSLPWLSVEAPHLKVSGHGLALWFTTPPLLMVFFPKRWTARMIGLAAAIVPVVVLDLAYQNSGWLQFGYRFALDYLPGVFVLLALGGRRFGRFFALAAVFALAVNLFGAITFDRAWDYYDVDGSQTRIFQPD
ncbi:MAG: hypothetical protein AAGH15_16280 [Myxococcota bacterium]